MGYEETFEVNRVQIRTTVTADVKEIEKHLSSFRCPSNNHLTNVVGFDVEWFLAIGNGNEIESKCATMQFFNGNSCLIIQFYCLARFIGGCSDDLAHKSLLNFFQQPNFIFVGVGIKENFVKLEKLYGFRCRNAVELGPFAATVMTRPHLSYCGVDELAAHVIVGLDLREHRPSSSTYDYVCNPLGKNLAKLVAVNVYSYFMIGRKLLN
jgi:Na+-transporting methylmalonyl-CoA/oxaloacetate decarboxylase beta subunit